VSLLERVKSDITAAMKSGERERVGALRLVSSELQKAHKEAAAGTVSVRRRGSRDEERGVALDAFVDRMKKERDSKALPADFAPHEPTAGDSLA